MKPVLLFAVVFGLVLVTDAAVVGDDPPANRATVDSNTGAELLMTSYAFPGGITNDEVTEWAVYAEATLIIDFCVYRPAGGNDYTLIGCNTVTPAATGVQTFPIAEGSRITGVQTGDVIGYRHHGSTPGVVSLDTGTSDTTVYRNGIAQDGGGVPTDPVGSTNTYPNALSRTYSLRATTAEGAAGAVPTPSLECGDGYTDGGYYYSTNSSVAGCDLANNANNCFFSVGALTTDHATTLRLDGQVAAPVSRLEANGGTDYVYLAFDAPSKYYDFELVFPDAAANECEYDDWELVGRTSPGTQTLNNGCYTTFEFRLPWSDAYNAAGTKCGWDRDDSGSNVKLTLDFAVRATEDLTTQRNGTVLTRTVDFSMPVQVEFPVQVVADTEDIQVFGEVRALAIVTEQSVTIDEPTEVATMKIRLFTEVQAPFELHTISETSNTLTTGTDGQDGLPTGITVATTFTDVNVLKTTACSNPAAICAATWEFEYETPSVAGGSNPCEFDGLYEVSFVVGCSDENANGDCPIDDATDSVSIQFSVNSNNHCPSVIDSVDLSATLEVYDTQARTGGEQDDFVGDGTTDNGQTPSPDDWQVAYFAAPTKSDQVAIDETELNQVWIIRGDASKVVLLDADNVHNDAPYNSVGAITCTPVQQPGDGNDADKATVTLQTGCDPTNPAGGTYNFDFKHGEGGNAAATAFSTPIFQFDVRTDSEGFDMADDAIETMTVHAVIDVRYANAAKRSAGVVQNEPRTDFTSVERTFQTNGQAASASSSSSSLFGMSSMMVYAAAATLVVVVVGVLVVVLKKPSQPAMEKMESSTELTSTVV